MVAMKIIKKTKEAQIISNNIQPYFAIFKK